MVSLCWIIVFFCAKCKTNSDKHPFQSIDQQCCFNSVTPIFLHSLSLSLWQVGCSQTQMKLQCSMPSWLWRSLMMWWRGSSSLSKSKGDCCPAMELKYVSVDSLWHYFSLDLEELIFYLLWLYSVLSFKFPWNGQWSANCGRTGA